MEQQRSQGKNNIYCIRLEADENKEKPEEGIVKPKGQYILNSLAKKLNPSPISTISSSSASLFPPPPISPVPACASDARGKGRDAKWRVVDADVEPFLCGDRRRLLERDESPAGVDMSRSL